MQAKTPTHPRRARSVFDYIDEIVRGYGPRVRVVQLWRRVDGARNVWTYLGRLAPEQCEIELIGKHFGGGEYRAKYGVAINGREVTVNQYFGVTAAKRYKTVVRLVQGNVRIAHP